ncbi:MAG: DUF111 family protein [Deltaproteobacteria bacterium]|nr:DUF111 family protein [Deltaproteobacteria bacterium]
MSLHINAKNGIAGNMSVAALIDLGADQETVVRTAENAASTLISTKAVLRKVSRNGIAALHLDTVCEDMSFPIEDIKRAIGSADIEGTQRALNILETLIKAEQEYHMTHHVHFHEIGCADLVFDIVGTIKALELLGETDITCTPVSVGGGTVTFSHGTLDVPAPATKKILETYRIPFAKGPIDRELATPTGVAILANIVGRYTEHASALQTGYGAGSNFNGIPNVLEISRVAS